MTDRVEGTVIVEGLLEGRLPENTDARDDLRQWVLAAKGRGLNFSVEIDAGRFSLLPDNAPIEITGAAAPADEIITEMLTELLELFTPPERLSLASTIRSIEIRPGQEVQTLYVVGPDGRIHSTQRISEARTVKPPEPLSTREKLKLAGVALGIAVLAVAISTFFIDYRAWFADFSDRMTALDANEIAIQAPAFESLFTVTDKTLVRRDRAWVLQLTLTPTKEFPANDAAIEAMLKTPEMSIRKRLAIEAIVRGYVRCDLLDKKGAAIAAMMPRLPTLAAGKTSILPIPLPTDERTALVLIVP